MTTCKKARYLDNLLIDARDNQVMLAHCQSRSAGILCLPRSDFNRMTGRQILRKFNEYIDSLAEGVVSEPPPEIPDDEPNWSQMSCWGMPIRSDKPVRKKPKRFKEVQSLPLKSVWLRARCNDLDEREPANDAVSHMTMAMEAIIEELHQRTLPPPPPPPPPPAPEIYEIPFGVARRRWRRAEQIPKTTQEFAVFFQVCGVSVLDVTPGSIQVLKRHASRINNILNGQNARPARL